MPERTYVKKVERKVTQKEAEELAAAAAAEQEAVEKAQDAQPLTDDELIDEIDALLEENDVLVNYKQRGGQ